MRLLKGWNLDYYEIGNKSKVYAQNIEVHLHLSLIFFNHFSNNQIKFKILSIDYKIKFFLLIIIMHNIYNS